MENLEDITYWEVRQNGDRVDQYIVGFPFYSEEKLIARYEYCGAAFYLDMYNEKILKIEGLKLKEGVDIYD